MQFLKVHLSHQRKDSWTDQMNKLPKKSKQKRLHAALKEHQGKTLLTSSDGEKYIDLGKKKRATVRSFKGTPLLDIREFYGADGQEKPGKKGISLTLDQWEALRESASTIDRLFSAQKKK
ncbi:PC4-domain-containing protein [Phlegmacium glaucopus]|nr:PC4-domain-containing protein [Phlegmacium glaucopus]